MMRSLLCVVAVLLFCYADALISVPDEIRQNQLQVPEDAVPCSDPALYACQHAYNEFLGIQGDADWHNPGILEMQVDRILYSGIPGYLKLCDARAKFYQCLGPTYYSCINPFEFIRQGFSVADAYAFVGIMHQQHFMCGGGLVIGLYHFPCITRVHATQTAVLNGCVRAFNASIHSNPSQICAAARTLLSCFRAPFGACTSQGSWWGCEVIRVGLQFDNVCPDLRCTVAGAQDEPAYPQRAVSQAKVDEVKRRLDKFVQ